MPIILAVLDFGDFGLKVFVNDYADFARLLGRMVNDAMQKISGIHLQKFTRKFLAQSGRAKLAYALGMTESQVKVGAQYFSCLRLWGLD